MSEMPDEVWISTYEPVATCSPPDYWPGGKWPAVFKQNRDRAVKYVRADLVEVNVDGDKPYMLRRSP